MSIKTSRSHKLSANESKQCGTSSKARKLAIRLETPKSVENDGRDFAFRGNGSNQLPYGYIKSCDQCQTLCGPQYHVREGSRGWWEIEYNWECECGHCMTGTIEKIRKEKTLQKKIIITGPGRSGTTFLIRLLARLGVQTGFPEASERLIEGTRGAGCEHIIADLPIYSQITPLVLKSPEWCFTLRPLLEKKIIDVEHIFIPIRDLTVAARSRLDTGLLWKIEESNLESQVAVHRAALGSLMETIALHNLDFTFMKFPKLVKYPNYCFSCLWDCKALHGYLKKGFRAKFQGLADPGSIKFKEA